MCKLTVVSRLQLSVALDQVIGTLDSTGCFVCIVGVGFVPMQLQGETVLIDAISRGMSATTGKCKWLVHTSVATVFKGIMYRDENGERIKAKGSLLYWGSLVEGVQVDENRVRVGQYFLPIRLEKLQQVLWPQSMVPVRLNPASSSTEQNEVRIYLLAPKSKGEYRLTGTVAGGWRDHLVLEAESVSGTLANMLKPCELYYLDLPSFALQDSEFKFQHHVQEGFWNKLQNVFSEVLEWEYDGVENNRTVKWDGSGSTLYMYYGRPEASYQDVVDFFKVALSGASLHDMNLARRKTNDVQRSLVQVTFKGAKGNAAQICIKKCLHDALSDILTGSIQSKPCGALYMWLAVLSQQIKGDLKGLDPVARHEVTCLISLWPMEIMSHALLGDGVHRAAKEAILEEARRSSQLSKQWLQGAIQVIVHGEVSTEEIIHLMKHAQRVSGDVLLQWGATGIQFADLRIVESALRVAFGAADRPALVWHAAMHFMQHINRQDVGQACTCIALQEVLSHRCTFYVMNWEEVISRLDCLLDKLVEGCFDTQLQQDLVSILQESWNSCCGRRVQIPAWINTRAMSCLAMALTAEPFRASQVIFVGESDTAWLGLAAATERVCVQASVTRILFGMCLIRSMSIVFACFCLGMQTKVKDEQWISHVARVAVGLVGGTRVEANLVKQALRVLFSLRNTVRLQRDVLIRLSSQGVLGSPSSLIEAILNTPSSTEEFEEQACYRFCLSQLEYSLQTVAPHPFQRPEQWQDWINLADQHKRSDYVGLVLQYALACAYGSCKQQEREEDLSEMAVILSFAGFWRKLLEIATRRLQPNLTEKILNRLRKSLKMLGHKITNEALTPREILGAGSMQSWKSVTLIELLSFEKRVEELKPMLDRMIEKIDFMKQFEEALRNLPSLFPGEPRGRDAAASLRKAFLQASSIEVSEETAVAELSVEMAQVNDDAWSQEFTENKEWWNDEMKLSADGVQAVGFRVLTFKGIANAIQTLHMARWERHKPLQCMFQEIEAKLAADRAVGCQFTVLDTLLFMYMQFRKTLLQLSELGAEDVGLLPPQILCSIEKHWAGVAWQSVPEILSTIQNMTGLFRRGKFTRIEDRLVSVLRGRQIADFWSLCRKIQSSLCSKKRMAHGFSEKTQLEAASLETLSSALAEASGENSVGLKTEDLDTVRNATQRTRELFDFLGPGGFDSVFRLVGSMADVPGLAFLRILLSSVEKGEHLATRLTELVEGALTQATLDSVEQASIWFTPFCVAVLSAMDVKVDRSKFQQMSGSSWSSEIQEEALGARSLASIGALMLNILSQAARRDGNRLPERIECLRSALRQGQVVQQKLEENSDDATAVSNTVHGMVSAGHLQLSASSDVMTFEVAGIFKFNKDQERITRDMQQLMECSDKASLAVPKGNIDLGDLTTLTSEKVGVFKDCVEGIIGLRQELSELLQFGHPYFQEKGELRFPEEGEGLSNATVTELKNWLKWAEEAKSQWYHALDKARAKHAIMSCIPARNITKIAQAILANEPGLVPPLLSFAVRSPACFVPDPVLDEAFKQCLYFRPFEDAHQQFLERIVEALAAQVVPEQALSIFPPLHEMAKDYPKSRRPDDSTTKSRVERGRTDPKPYPKRVLLIQEEVTHETGNSSLQSVAAVTVLSVLLPLGVGPGPENLLLCDSTTTKDDVLRFLHRVTHATRLACGDGRQSQVLGLFVHVDCLQPDVRQVLLSKVGIMQASVGKRKEVPDGTAEIEVRLVFTVTPRAPKPLMESLEKDLCKLQQIKILKLDTIAKFLQNAQTCLGVHRVVWSDYAGDGKTHAIHKSAGWDQASHASIVWGGAQTRGQAARALKGACTKCVHLELHSFEEGGGVDAETLLLELLLFRCVFDPEGSEWVRLPVDTALFLEVANSIKIKQGAMSTQLMLLSAPILRYMPDQLQIDSNEPFSFGLADFDLATAPPSARSFALAGAALLLGDERQRLVGCQGDAGVVFHLVADSAGTVVPREHSNLLQFRSTDINQAAQVALQEAWRNSQMGVADEDPAPVPSKATIMSFLTFLARWTAKWVHHTVHFEQTFVGEKGVNVHLTLLPILKEMIGMAAAMCLRSSAAEAQDQQRQRLHVEAQDNSASLSEAMACRVKDGRIGASTVWAFNTGDSLRFIGNNAELPAALKNLWKALRRTGQKFQEPPVDLDRASQADLRKLLLEVMSGHGLNREERWAGWVGAVGRRLYFVFRIWLR